MSSCGWCRRARYGNLLQHLTGSKAHNVALREDAVRRGLKVSEYGIEDVETGEVFQTDDEAEVYERLGLPWIPPELREDRGELEAARERRAARARGGRRRSAGTCTRTPTGATARRRSSRWWTAAQALGYSI